MRCTSFSPANPILIAPALKNSIAELMRKSKESRVEPAEGHERSNNRWWTYTKRSERFELKENAEIVYAAAGVNCTW